ncbi:LruC domain-containing protein [Phocaeicola sp.]
MKRGIFYCTAFICLLTSSCIDKDKLSPSPDGGKENDNKLDLSFDFSMKSSKELSITVESVDNNSAAKIPFYVYLDNPYTEEGGHKADIMPLFKGNTDQNGKIKTTVTVPNTATQLYIYTPYSTYGGMQTCDIQNNMAVTFRSIYLMADAKAVKARAGEQTFVGERTGKSINSTTKVYSYYTFDLNSSLASFGMISNNKPTDPDIVEVGNTLTSEEEYWANYYFPEKITVPDEKYFNADYCTDLLVQRPSGEIGGEFKGAHVWVTFIGDGGFSTNNANVINSLCYYTYTGELNGNDAQTIHKTVIYPSTNVNKFRAHSSLVIGSRVQLLYWDGKKYIDTFPEGTKIGWAMVSGGSNGFPNSLNNIDNFRFSTPILNSKIGTYPGSYANGIGRWCEEANMNIVGMENRQHLDIDIKNNDKDYNDILFKVTSDPVIKPITEVPVNPEVDSQNISGTLTFEDNWPKLGDYDFNDFVTSYTYSLVKDKGESMVKSILMTFIPRALGATYNSGFAIELPIDAGNVKEVTGGRLENESGNAVIIIYDDTRRDGFGGKGGYINTQAGSTHITGTTSSITVTLQNKISLDTFNGFNPFIYVNGREHEIHLTDMTPTAKMDLSLLGTEDDKSDQEKGIYYRTDNVHPWALDIPSADNSINSVWGYPIEGTIISDAYPNYNDWTTNHTINWLTPQTSDKIYK